MTMKNAITVTNVWKSFKLPHEKNTGLKQALINFRPGKKYEVQDVLKGLNFNIKEGEFFGIVGRNGSGKSTLLKLLAQIYTPNQGEVSINGTLTPFIELGVGFNPELTGRENVFLNGSLLGFDRSETIKMYDDIVNFAELERFMDQKLKNYSSGMQVRLAFSIAIRAKTDILLIDEVLAVGDAAFQQKCFTYFEELKRTKTTVVLVTHDMGSVKQFCDRAALIEAGEITHIGKPEDVALEYENINYRSSITSSKQAQQAADHNVRTLDPKGVAKDSFRYGEPIVFETNWGETKGVKNVGFAIFKGAECVFATNSFDQTVTLDGSSARLLIEPKFGNGRYRVALGLFGDHRHQVLAESIGHEFLIYNQPLRGEKNDEWVGVTYTKNHWQ
jgi:ABC-2 type transport system ATP-binding protein